MKYIKIPIYHMINEKGKKIIDVDSITEEFNTYLEEIKRRNQL